MGFLTSEQLNLNRSWNDSLTTWKDGFSGFSRFEWLIQNRDFSIIRVSTLRQPFIHESVWLIISYLEAKHLLKYFSPDEVPKGPTRPISERMKIFELYILNVKQKFQIQNGDAITSTSGHLRKCPKIIPRLAHGS